MADASHYIALSKSYFINLVYGCYVTSEWEEYSAFNLHFAQLNEFYNY